MNAKFNQNAINHDHPLQNDSPCSIAVFMPPKRDYLAAPSESASTRALLGESSDEEEFVDL